MIQPILFVDEFDGDEGEQVRRTIERIASHGSTTIRHSTMLDGSEVDIIIVNSVAQASHYLEKTSKTLIGVYVGPLDDVFAAAELASRNSDRVRVMKVDGSGGFGRAMISIITDKIGRKIFE